MAGKKAAPCHVKKMEESMKSYIVKDLMVPLSEYATVSEDATLYESILALEEAQENFKNKHTRYRHRAVLVLDKDGAVIGKISQLDMLRALEPKYQDMLLGVGSHRYGFTKQFMKSMLESYHLFANPLDDICRKAGGQNVKSIMSTPTESDNISQDTSLDNAIHQFIMGNQQSLLVTDDKKTVGILRQTDVFTTVFNKMKACFIN
jgi:CBS domain-containing protein